MTNVDFKSVSYNHVKGYCWSKEVNTDVILDVYEYHNLELNFSWEESERTCMVCRSDCRKPLDRTGLYADAYITDEETDREETFKTIKELFYQSVEDEEIDEDPIWSAQRDDHKRLEEEG